MTDIVSGQLMDGLALHAENPKTFEIPTDGEKQSLLPGDLVKVGITFKPEYGELATGERFWVKILMVAKGEGETMPSFIGRVCDDLVYASTHGIDKDAILEFGCQHILVVK